MNVNDQQAELSGLEQLKALLNSGRRPPIAETLQIDLTEVEPGRVVSRPRRPTPRWN